MRLFFSSRLCFESEAGLALKAGILSPQEGVKRRCETSAATEKALLRRSVADLVECGQLRKHIANEDLHLRPEKNAVGVVAEPEGA